MLISELRNNLPASQQHVFLNYAATSPMLKPCFETMCSVLKRGLEPLSLHFYDNLSLLEKSRKAVADTIGARVNEIAFTTNTSTGLSLIAASIPWKEGDRVLYLEDDFPSNRYVWQNLRKKRVQAESFVLNPSEDVLDKLNQINLKQVRLISVSAVSYLDGRSFDIKRIADFCHAHGILLVVDAIQAVGAISVKMKEWDCDFLACGAQKWLLGPVGTGFIYVKEALLNQLDVPMAGWANARNAGDFSVKQFQFVDGAKRYEPGLPDIAGIAGLAKSIETLSKIGWTRIFESIVARKRSICSALRHLDFEPVNEDPSGITTVTVEEINSHQRLVELLQVNNVIISAREKQIRISAHASTSDGDIDKLMDAFHKQKAGNRKIEPSPKGEPLRNAKKHETTSSKECALITGASQGLGRAMAYELAKRGWDLILLAKDGVKLEKVQDDLRNKYRINAEMVCLDLSDSKAILKFMRESLFALNIDVLINNAVSADARLFIEMDLELLKGQFDVNFFAPLYLTQGFLPGMLERKKGRILNIVTSGSRCALPLFSGYNASKAAFWSWSEALGRELKNTGVHVTTFLPPHMGSQTQQHLGRKILAYYDVDLKKTSHRSLASIAETAIDALLAGKEFVAPWQTRLKLALNAINSAWITNMIIKRWKG
ncbi:MAG: aminotransferase class V-fold PLP-dependent enzyme [Chlamydiota bacterium]|nr:aminotransferase class V-fold PLP-dependent enzyme [Chlamydiota bacterium]